MAPQPGKLARIQELLGLLGLDQQEQGKATARINSFSNTDEFHAWLKEFDQ
jgi:hypothetical protein